MENSMSLIGTIISVVSLAVIFLWGLASTFSSGSYPVGNEGVFEDKGNDEVES